MTQTLLFSCLNKVGTLNKALKFFAKHKVNLSKIESKPATFSKSHYEFICDIEDDSVSKEDLSYIIQEMSKDPLILRVQLLGGETVPWFPRHISDIDKFSAKILAAGGDLESDHPGFKDKEYRKRREEIAQIAINYRHGNPIPRVEYTPDEVKTWGAVYEKLTARYQKFACREMNHVLPLLEENCGYSKNNIPQLDDVSNFLKRTTGFQLRPVTGLLSGRDFLAGLAFRVFHSTQYIRHHSVPLYTPEPDIIHELMGHAPLFADPEFADFSQEIGLASLGQSDEDIKKLSTLYWFTIEFGLCRQEGQIKAYGAGLLSSFGELEYSMSDKPKLLPLDPEKTSITEYPITTYQPTYFVADSFEKVKEQVANYSTTLKRPFSVRYNPFTQSVEILDDRKKLLNQVRRISNETRILKSALETVTNFEGNSWIKFETKSEKERESV